MKRSLLLAALFIPMLSFAQVVKVVDFDAIHSLLDTRKNNVQVINFWATWCGPCVRELPHFQKIMTEQADRVDMHFVSLDFADKLDNVEKFVQNKGWKGDIMLLDDIDYDGWISRVDSTWSGAIPATLFLNTQSGERHLVEREMTENEIRSNILSLLH